MGTTAFWVMMNRYSWLVKKFMVRIANCRYPEMNSMIQLMVGMAPVAAAAHMYSPIKYIAPVAGPVEVGRHALTIAASIYTLLESSEYDWTV